MVSDIIHKEKYPSLGSTPSRDLNSDQSLVLLQQQAKEFIKPRKGISAC